MAFFMAYHEMKSISNPSGYHWCLLPSCRAVLCRFPAVSATSSVQHLGSYVSVLAHYLRLFDSVLSSFPFPALKSLSSSNLQSCSLFFYLIIVHNTACL